MIPVVYSTTSFAELVRFIHETLCAHERFDPDQTPLKKSVIRRNGRVTGLMLRLEGSRLHRCHAVWAEEEHRVLFYNSAGQRFGEVKLADSPDLQTEVMRSAA